MSYKALLFCPDERTARVVTQVLSELEFTVERSSEPFATVKKLTDQHFDAVVVDCQNEQDASLLFKGARNSSLNHSSLSVAVVEGQAGVAKAFRIGANLVLTKPINIEQSKSTLRVARGLLRKNEAKPAAASASASLRTTSGAPAFASKSVPIARVTPPAASVSAPFSALELEKEPTPEPEPAEVAVLESLPDPVKPATSHEQTWAPTLKNSAQPIAASTAGQAAAAAPARIKPATEIKTAPPLATQEPIVADHSSSERFEATSVPVPTFSSYAQGSGETGGKGIFKTAAILLIVGAIGYIGWHKLQPLQYLHHATSAQPVKSPVSTPAAAPAPSSSFPESSLSDAIPASNPAGYTSSSQTTTASEHNYVPETIQVDEALATPEPKITVVPKPLVVKSKPSAPVTQKPAQPTPPSLSLSAENNSDSALASIVTTNAVVPKASAESVRVSQGVSQGLILKRVPPAYPTIALQQRKQGAVELLATISKDGAITSIKVLNGDSVLAKSATDAVRQWKYRPYLLNGEPVEIQTQITVNFKLPH